MLTQEKLKEYISYNSDTDEWIRIKNTYRQNLVGKEAGWINSLGYRCINILGKQYYAHHLAWLYMTGNWPEEIDHKDGNPSNNKWSNLRLSDRQENNYNKGKQKRNTSGYKGVTWFERDKNWKAQIGFQKDGKRKMLHIGYFNDPKEAANAYNQAALVYHGEFARLNVI